MLKSSGFVLKLPCLWGTQANSEFKHKETMAWVILVSYYIQTSSCPPEVLAVGYVTLELLRRHESEKMTFNIVTVQLFLVGENITIYQIVMLCQTR